MATRHDHRCPSGAAAQDVAAWLLDGHPLPPEIDEGHVRSCPACSRVVDEMSRSRDVGEILRTEIRAPDRTVELAVQRVRLEMVAREVLATFVDGLATVSREALNSAGRHPEEP